MNRRTRTLVVIGVAVLLASLASYGVYRAVQQIPVREVTVVERQQVVAKEFIPVGVLVTPEQLKLVPWPANAPVMGGFTSVEEVAGRGVTAAFVENEAIIEGKLAPRDSGGGLPPKIPEGMRAVSVRVNDVSSVAGYTTPGTRVDVVMVTTPRSGEPISKTVLSNVQVLMAGPRYEEDRARKEAMPTNVLTLLLTPEDAERLTLATSQGSITLALRNPLDTVPTDTNGVRMANLLSGTNAPPVRVNVGANRTRIVTPTPPPPPPPHTIEVISGTSRTEIQMKKSGKAGGDGGGLNK